MYPNLPFSNTTRGCAFLSVMIRDSKWLVTQGDSRRVFTWREPRICYNHPKAEKSTPLTPEESLSWVRMILCSRKLLDVFDAGSVNTQHYRIEFLEAHVKLFRGLRFQNSFLWTIMWRHIELPLLMISQKRWIFANMVWHEKTRIPVI